MALWFVLFSIIFCLNPNFLFCNCLTIPSDTKIKWSFGANSREDNKFFNLDYLTGPNTWVINYKYVANFNQYIITPTELSNFPSDTEIIKNKPSTINVYRGSIMVFAYLLRGKWHVKEDLGAIGFPPIVVFLRVCFWKKSFRKKLLNGCATSW